MLLISKSTIFWWGMCLERLGWVRTKCQGVRGAVKILRMSEGYVGFRLDGEATMGKLSDAIAEHDARTTNSFGIVRGRVETLSHRRGLRFFLYDLATDKAVRCHPDSGLEDTMRSVWGSVVDVAGTVTRDAATGQPISIRHITSVNTIEEGDPMGYLRARGALRIGEPAEEAVRRIRDAVR